jgi:hypothetical protein
VTILGLLAAVILGIIKGQPNFRQLGSHLLLNVFVTAPIAALSLGVVALGAGVIIGTCSVAARTSIVAGLEWALIGGMAVAIGVGARYPRWRLVLAACILGSAIGGTIGLLTWLRHHTGSRTVFTPGIVTIYVMSFISIAIYAYLTAGWCISFLG